MAFHPFHWFRKHQKVFFAILTIICMFVFVATGFMGDFLTRGMGRGGMRQQGKQITTLYGRKVYEGTLQTLALDRGLVNDLMLSLLIRANMELGQDFEAGLKTVPGNLAEPLRRAHGGIFQREQMRRFGFPMDRETNFQAIRRDLELTWSIRWGNVDKPEALRQIDALLTLLEIEAYFENPSRKPTDLFFGGTRSTEDLLDYMIWQQQADRLGITLTEAELVKAITTEMGGVDVLQLQTQRNKSLSRSFVIQSYLAQQQRRDPSMTEAKLVKLLTDEFRVQMAKRGILGEETGFRAYRGGVTTPTLVRSPAALTPDQFYDYYRKERTTVNLTLLDLPVAGFLSQVAAQPRQTDLEQLFNRFKDVEPDPRLPRPGFKVPRRVKIAFFSFKDDMPYFQAKARALEYGRLVSRLTSPLWSLAAPGGVIGAGLVANELRQDSLLEAYAAYENKEKNRPWYVANRLFEGEPILRDAHLFRTETLGFATAEALASAALPAPVGLGNLYAITWTMAATASRYQEAERQKALQGVLTVVSYLSVAPNGVDPLPLAAALPLPVAPVTPTVLPPQVVATMLLQKQVDNVARTETMQFERNFREELTKVRGTADKAEAYITETLKKIGAEKNFHAMTRLEDRFALEDDPVLQPLKAAFGKSFRPNQQQKFVDFLLSGRPGTYDPGDVNSEGSTYIFWRSEDLKAHELNSLDEARPVVVEAWKRQVAREKAREKARDIEKALKERQEKTDNPEDLVKYLRDQMVKVEKSARLLELDGVARLVKPREVVPVAGRAYVGYVPPKDRIEYPRPDFADKVLETLQKPGDSMVLTDEPQMHFYVIVATARQVPDVTQLLDVYAQTPNPDPFWMQDAMPDSVKSYDGTVMRELRIAAAGASKVNKEGQIILPDDVPKNFSNVSETSE